ncbi:MAG: CobB/CobQ domain protein glutamine amidotransferase [Thermoleophilia bacterium]|nr:CobB/CobQ domain protein glutamine amidotransferase [Thermoleophilia bacterium]
MSDSPATDGHTPSSPVSVGGRPRVRILHLYDRYLNIYADRGNIQVLRQRAAWRGIDVEVQGLEPGERFEPGEHDLLYVGGGQDRDQAMIAERMSEDLGPAIKAAAEEGTAVLAVCGGYQLLGSHYLDTNGVHQPGVGLFDLSTTAGPTRLIGNVAIEAELPAIGARAAATGTIAGFENHAGRTELGSSARALGTVVYGAGNDGSSGLEGCRLHHAVGTYLHGPLLPRNPGLADWLLAAALAHAHGTDAAGLVDREDSVPPRVAALERAARDAAVARARGERR